MAQVKVYMSQHCPHCVRAKQLLDKKQVQYAEIRIDLDASKREEMMALTGRRTVPQIFIDDQPIGGCDDLYALEQEGKLDAMLN